MNLLYAGCNPSVGDEASLQQDYLGGCRKEVLRRTGDSFTLTLQENLVLLGADVWYATLLIRQARTDERLSHAPVQDLRHSRPARYEHLDVHMR